MRYWNPWNSFNTSPRFVRRLAWFVSLGAVILGGGLASWAAKNEITGNAFYREHYHRGSRPEPVTRETSPIKFRRATNLIWAVSGFSLTVGTVSFIIYRRIDDLVDESF